MLLESEWLNGLPSEGFEVIGIHLRHFHRALVPDLILIMRILLLLLKVASLDYSYWRIQWGIISALPISFNLVIHHLHWAYAPWLLLLHHVEVFSEVPTASGFVEILALLWTWARAFIIGFRSQIDIICLVKALLLLLLIPMLLSVLVGWLGTRAVVSKWSLILSILLALLLQIRKPHSHYRVIIHTFICCSAKLRQITIWHVIVWVSSTVFIRGGVWKHHLCHAIVFSFLEFILGKPRVNALGCFVLMNHPLKKLIKVLHSILWRLLPTFLDSTKDWLSIEYNKRLLP